MSSGEQQAKTLAIAVAGQKRGASRTQETRRTLLKAARAVLRRKGYVGATVADIVSEAGRAHGTFYLHFTNKEAVYAVLLGEMWEDLKVQGRSMWNADAPMTSVVATVRRFVEAYEENLDLWELAEDMSAINPYFRQLRVEHRLLLARKVRSGIEGSLDIGATQGLDLDVLSDILAGMLEAACHGNFREGPRRPAAQLAQHIAIVWGRALGYVEANGAELPKVSLVHD